MVANDPDSIVQMVVFDTFLLNFTPCAVMICRVSASAEFTFLLTYCQLQGRSSRYIPCLSRNQIAKDTSIEEEKNKKAKPVKVKVVCCSNY